ncbi:MAG: hypothetical protein APZ16_04480 [Candidatus Hadarchaeum yellowstonense]|uniref:Zona occludens toxin N-terminal domain-containing protein n=1 Tax=Hadarchaeum yellowstonense TaxID=1776334 RepID=A0A147JVW9_HADYE|nr:MAG: hypothetical protein APZ16_04480 [Candidatus Hadarchaeum yellowstonense]
MVSFDYKSGHFWGEASARAWLDAHLSTVMRFLWEKVDPKDHEEVLKLFHDTPEIGRRIMEDYLASDEEKLEKIKRDIVENEGMIILILGAKGAGKSAFGTLLLEMAHEGGKLCYVVGAEEQTPPFAKTIRNPARATSNSVVLVDEAAVRYGARTSMRALQRDTLGTLHTLRHTGRNYIVVTQTASDADVKWFRNADRLVIKRQTQFAEEFERKPLMRFIEIMRPHDVKGTLYWADTFHVFIKNTPLPKCWSEKMSKVYKVWDEETALEKGREMLQDDYTAEEIQIEAQLHSFIKPIAWWVEKLFQEQQPEEIKKKPVETVQVISE